MCEEEEIECLISTYAKVRKCFEDMKDECPEYLYGNDNYVGIIGEYWAIKFLEQTTDKKEALKKFLENRGGDDDSKSKKWTDITLENESISVKTIFESNNQTCGDIKYKEAENEEILSVIIVKLDKYLKPKEILYIKDINKNLANGEKDYFNRHNEKKAIKFKYYDYGFDDVFIESKCIYQYKDNKFKLKTEKDDKK